MDHFVDFRYSCVVIFKTRPFVFQGKATEYTVDVEWRNVK